MLEEIVVKLENIYVSFKKENQTSFFGRERYSVLKNISINIEKGETVGILGESGSGKSTLGRVICELLKPDKGTIFIQKPLSIVFQDYTTSVNPRFKVKDIILESIEVRERNEKIKLDKEYIVNDILNVVGLEVSLKDRYPHQLSGGQLQRVCIARAVALNPKIILFDEAVSSLDANTQVQVLNLLNKIKKQFDLTYIFITHDLMSITYFCNRVLFLCEGEIVEDIFVKDLKKIKNDYAKKLLYSI